MKNFIEFCTIMGADYIATLVAVAVLPGFMLYMIYVILINLAENDKKTDSRRK